MDPGFNAYRERAPEIYRLGSCGLEKLTFVCMWVCGRQAGRQTSSQGPNLLASLWGHPFHVNGYKIVKEISEIEMSFNTPSLAYMYVGPSMSTHLRICPSHGIYSSRTQIQ